MSDAEIQEMYDNGYTAAEMKQEMDEREADKELQRHPAKRSEGQNHD